VVYCVLDFLEGGLKSVFPRFFVGLPVSGDLLGEFLFVEVD